MSHRSISSLRTSNWATKTARQNQKWSGEAIGFFNVTPQQLADLRAGRWYMDVHTEGRPNGEIRGQLTVLSVASHRFQAPASGFWNLNAFSQVNEPLKSVNDISWLEFWKFPYTAGAANGPSVGAGERLQGSGRYSSAFSPAFRAVMKAA